jgi:hypothetical protein
MRSRKDQTHAPRNGVSGRTMAYLRVEKPRFLFLVGSVGAKATTVAATVAPPDASVARATSSVDRPTAGASTPAPGACSSAASATLGEGGAGSHLSGTSTLTSPGEKSPAARAVGTLRLIALGVGSPAPSSAPPAPIPATAPRALELRVWAGQTAQRLRPPSAREDETSESRRHTAKG